MPRYVEPKYKRAEIDKAGRILVSASMPSVLGAAEIEWALDVINNWRLAHGVPLNGIAMSLRNRAIKRDGHAILAQRSKRLRSIEAKLRRFPSMRLSQVQDIGGCRAVVLDVDTVRRIVEDYDTSDSKAPNRHQRVGFKDYVAEPKSDGYRGVHLIYSFRGNSTRTSAYDGQMIEIQLRSKLQHAWATAVETVDIFTGQALKSSAGTADWHRFFALMSSAIAYREKAPSVPGTPEDEYKLFGDLLDLARSLDVRTKLEGWRRAVQHFETNVANASIYLLVLDSVKQMLHITGFTDAETAAEHYATAEQNRAANAVLVGVDSITALPAAYPNYYLDTDMFIDALQFAMDWATAIRHERRERRPRRR